MSRKSTKLRFDGDSFKGFLKERSLTIERFSEAIRASIPGSHLSVTTIHENMKEGAASRENLISIAKYLNLSQKEFKILMGSKPLPVFFRRERMEDAEEEAKDLVRSLGDLYFSLRPYKTHRKALPKFTGLSPAELSFEIRNLLKLPVGKVSFDEVVNSLEEFGVHVHFYPFQLLGIKKTNKKNYRAACILKESNWLILLDTSNTIHDALFDLFHELAHIFSGHDLNNQTKEIESYSNNTAAEVLTPTKFFQKNSDYLKQAVRNPSPRIVGEVGFIQDVLGASFEGVVLALNRNGFLTDDSKKYLFACIQRKRAEIPSINQILDIENSTSEKWASVLVKEEDTEYLSIFKKFKSAYLANKVTTRVISTVFGLVIEEADHLCRIWTEELSISQEEVDAVKDDEICQGF